MIQQQVSAKALRIISVSEATAERVRSLMRDDYGNDLVVQDGEGAPCRVCLRYGKAGERVILLSYRPFDKPGTYQEVGPIFVHADPCENHASDSGFPKDFLDRPLILRPYDAEDRIQDSQVFTEPGEAQAMAARMLENPAVAYVHARSRSRGCYLFRIERG
jgi:hypothetical protein